jgi:hypothetical protein
MASNVAIRVPIERVTWFRPNLNPKPPVKAKPDRNVVPQPEPYLLGIEAGRQWASMLATWEMLDHTKVEIDEGKARLFTNGFWDGALAVNHELATEPVEESKPAEEPEEEAALLVAAR